MIKIMCPVHRVETIGNLGDICKYCGRFMAGICEECGEPAQYFVQDYYKYKSVLSPVVEYILHSKHFFCHFHNRESKYHNEYTS